MTIYALATAPGKAGVAVVRISGPQAGAALRALSGQNLPEPRRAVRRRLTNPASGDWLDDALVLWFQGPASFTGEDVAELHLHGGRAVVSGVIAALAALPGLRLAEPGEFTRRAFDAGKLDLAAVEGLADLVVAETAAQRRQALRQLGGALTERTETWRKRLVSLLAHTEADIDFPDEDLPEGVSAAVVTGVQALAREIAVALDDGGRGERLRDGLHVTIIGAPNAGKSSLLNALARRDVAIVSQYAGTTRDVVEVHLELDGYPVTLADTAGLRDSTDPVEQEGIARARVRAAQADIVLAVIDGQEWPSIPAAVIPHLTDDTLVIVNKADLLNGVPEGVALAISAKTGIGLPELLAALSSRCHSLFDGMQAAPITRTRHREALTACVRCLESALNVVLPELVAEEIRLAARALGRISGRVDVEELLDVIFRDFCIGK